MSRPNGVRLKRLAAWTVTVVLSLSAMLASAQAQLVAGRDYRDIKPPQLTADKTKIEVIEFFSYGCHSCADFAPFFGPWESKQAADVTVVRVPISLGHPQWEPLVRTYYALLMSGDLKRLDKSLFDAINTQRRNLTTDAEIVKWVGQQGVDGAKFAALLKSFSVVSKAAEAETTAKRYKVHQTPTVVVDGKYLLATNKAFSEWPLLMDQLVGKVRAEKSTAKK